MSTTIILHETATQYSPILNNLRLKRTQAKTANVQHIVDKTYLTKNNYGGKAL